MLNGLSHQLVCSLGSWSEPSILLPEFGEDYKINGRPSLYKNKQSRIKFKCDRAQQEVVKN